MIGPLNAKEAKAATLRAQGYTQTDAWRIAFNRPRTKANAARIEASKMSSRIEVCQRVRELLARANILDVNNTGQAYRDMLGAVDHATAEEIGPRLPRLPGCA